MSSRSHASPRPRRPYARSALLLAMVAGGALAAPRIGAAQARDPFALFLGNWRGSGFVVGADGSRTRITCRANYTLSEKGDGLAQSLTCASDSYRFEITSYVVANGGSVQGYWREATRQAQGNLTGQVTDGDFEGAVDGPGFNAGISLKASGRKQSVHIAPNGAGGIADVSVLLARQS